MNTTIADSSRKRSMAKHARRRSQQSSEDEQSSKRDSRSRRREQSDSKRSRARPDRAQQPSAQLQNPAVAHSTYPELGPSATNADLPVDSVIPQPKREPMASRGYGAEAQHHIMRAVEGTGTDPHDVPDPVLDVLGSGAGQSLDGSIQRALEDRMDADFSNVRIHTGPKAANAADAIDAKAFTCGNAIVFNDGEYEPGSAEGQHLLAHELAHVKQQTGAAISMMPQADADLEIDPDPQLEREADQAAEEALSGEEPLIVNRMGTNMHIQRSTKGESVSSPSRIRQIVAEEIEARVPEAVDKRLEQRSEELEELLDEDAPADLGVDVADIEGGDSSWFERLKDGLTNNRTAVAGGVGATFAALTTVASAGSLPLLAAAGVAASGSFAAKMFEGGVTEAALGEESNLTDEEFATIVETVKRELQESSETGDDNSRGLANSSTGGS